MIKQGVFILLFAILLISACNSENPDKKQNTDPHHDAGIHQVVVSEYQHASQYTYMRVLEADSSYWIAVPHLEVVPKDTLYFTSFMEMKDFHSETLQKTFDRVLFVDDIKTKDMLMTKGSGKMMPNGVKHPEIDQSSFEDITVEKLADGYSVAELFAKKEELNGKQIRIKGKVVKVRNQIMNRNWVHIQDGTKHNGNFDLTVTTQDFVNPGDVIIIEGTLSAHKDFGSGYKYEVIIEKATVVNQQAS